MQLTWEGEVFYSGNGVKSSRHCMILQCAHCKYTVWPLYNHCIPTVKAIAFESISQVVPTVNLQRSGNVHCKFTMRMSGNIVNLQLYHYKFTVLPDPLMVKFTMTYSKIHCKMHCHHHHVIMMSS